MDAEQNPGRWSGVAKFAAVSAAVLLLSLGLCGIAMHAPNNYDGGLAVIGLIGVIVGAVGLLGAGATSLMMLLFPSKINKDKP